MQSIAVSIAAPFVMEVRLGNSRTPECRDFFIVDRCEAERGVVAATTIDKIRSHEGFLPALGFFFSRSSR
jgi:hypothetical protein